MVTVAEQAIAATPLVSPKGGGMWRYILFRFFLLIPTVFILSLIHI